MNYQNVTDLPNNNTIFLVWAFKKDLDKFLKRTINDIKSEIKELKNHL